MSARPMFDDPSPRAHQDDAGEDTIDLRDDAPPPQESSCRDHRDGPQLGWFPWELGGADLDR